MIPLIGVHIIFFLHVVLDGRKNWKTTRTGKRMDTQTHKKFIQTKMEGIDKIFGFEVSKIDVVLYILLMEQHYKKFKILKS